MLHVRRCTFPEELRQLVMTEHLISNIFLPDILRCLLNPVKVIESCIVGNIIIPKYALQVVLRYFDININNLQCTVHQVHIAFLAWPLGAL